MTSSRSGPHRLFREPVREFKLPALERAPFEDAFDELELLGFSLCDPFGLLKTQDRGNTLASKLRKKLGSKVEMTGYLITTKNTSTKDGKPMHFGTFYDQEGQVFDTTHFPGVTRKFPFRGKGFYFLKGKVVEDFGYPMVEISFMDKLPMVSRDSVNSYQ